MEASENHLQALADVGAVAPDAGGTLHGEESAPLADFGPEAPAGAAPSAAADAAPARAAHGAFTLGTYLNPGDTVAGRYRIERIVGSGAMGVVYLAERTEDGAPVAIKLLRADLARDQMLAGRLRREAAAMRKVQHPNVVTLFDEGDAGELGPYIAMEHLAGESLSARLTAQRRLAPADAVGVTEDILAALAAAHAVGVVHRDLKPENVFLVPGEGPEGAPERAKVLDFGISQILRDFETEDSMKLTRTGTVVGTPVYMAPEQALGDGRADHRVDVYAAGVALYEMLSGCVPHEGENYNQVLAHALTTDAIPLASRNIALDPGLVAIVHRAIERDPASRYQTAADFRGALVAWRESFMNRSVRATVPAPRRESVHPFGPSPSRPPGSVTTVTQVLRPSRASATPAAPARNSVVQPRRAVPLPSRIAIALAVVTSAAVLGLAAPSPHRADARAPRASAAALPRLGAHAVVPTTPIELAAPSSSPARTAPALAAAAAPPAAARTAPAAARTAPRPAAIASRPASSAAAARPAASRRLRILVSNPYHRQ